jgi:hypothetical protein
MQMSGRSARYAHPWVGESGTCDRHGAGGVAAVTRALAPLSPIASLLGLDVPAFCSDLAAALEGGSGCVQARRIAAAAASFPLVFPRLLAAALAPPPHDDCSNGGQGASGCAACCVGALPLMVALTLGQCAHASPLLAVGVSPSALGAAWQALRHRVAAACLPPATAPVACTAPIHPPLATVRSVCSQVAYTLRAVQLGRAALAPAVADSLIPVDACWAVAESAMAHGRSRRVLVDCDAPPAAEGGAAEQCEGLGDPTRRKRLRVTSEDDAGSCGGGGRGSSGRSCSGDDSCRSVGSIRGNGGGRTGISSGSVAGSCSVGAGRGNCSVGGGGGVSGSVCGSGSGGSGSGSGGGSSRGSGGGSVSVGGGSGGGSGSGSGGSVGGGVGLIASTQCAPQRSKCDGCNGGGEPGDVAARKVLSKGDVGARTVLSKGDLACGAAAGLMVALWWRLCAPAPTALPLGSPALGREVPAWLAALIGESHAARPAGLLEALGALCPSGGVPPDIAGVPTADKQAVCGCPSHCACPLQACAILLPALPAMLRAHARSRTDPPGASEAVSSASAPAPPAAQSPPPFLVHEVLGFLLPRGAGSAPHPKSLAAPPRALAAGCGGGDAAATSSMGARQGGSDLARWLTDEDASTLGVGRKRPRATRVGAYLSRHLPAGERAQRRGAWFRIHYSGVIAATLSRVSTAWRSGVATHPRWRDDVAGSRVAGERASHGAVVSVGEGTYGAWQRAAAAMGRSVGRRG